MQKAKDCTLLQNKRQRWFGDTPPPLPGLFEKSMTRPKHIIRYFKGNPPEIPISYRIFQKF